MKDSLTDAATDAAQRSTTGATLSNVGAAERWLSLIGGVGLLWCATRGNALGRLALASAALPLLARGAAGYCPVKAALDGESSVEEGFKEQWRRLAADVASARERYPRARRIESMEAMYLAELQELQSAETQLCELAHELIGRIRSVPLATRVRAYANELDGRRADLESLLTLTGADSRRHPDDAMRALVHEAHKMARLHADRVRDSALAASLQRILHYKIAGYGTIAAYAKALGRADDAARFHRFAEQDGALDAELTELAKQSLNPEAVIEPRAAPEGVQPPMH